MGLLGAGCSTAWKIIEACGIPDGQRGATMNRVCSVRHAEHTILLRTPERRKRRPRRARCTTTPLHADPGARFVGSSPAADPTTAGMFGMPNTCAQVSRKSCMRRPLRYRATVEGRRRGGTKRDANLQSACSACRTQAGIVDDLRPDYSSHRPKCRLPRRDDTRLFGMPNIRLLPAKRRSLRQQT